MAPADSSTAPIAERQLACHVSLEDDSPVLHVVESCSMAQHSMAQHSMAQHSMAQHSGITLRKYALHSVDDDASHTPSQQAVSGRSPNTAHRKCVSSFLCMAQLKALCMLNNCSRRAFKFQNCCLFFACAEFCGVPLGLGCNYTTCVT